MVCMSGGLMSLLFYKDPCEHCLLCKCIDEYIVDGKIVSQDELKDNLKKMLKNDVYWCYYWSNTMLKYFAKNIDSFEDFCNEIFWITMKDKYYVLFDKCIECDNLEISDMYFCDENYDVISNPYYLEKIERKGKYFSDIEIENLFNHYIKTYKWFVGDLKFYIDKNVKIHESNYDYIRADTVLKFTNVDYVKLLSHKINNRKYKFVTQIIEKIEMDYRFIKVYEILVGKSKICLNEELNTCLKIIHEPSLNYLKKKIKMRFHLHKVLCNDIVRYIETFY